MEGELSLFHIFPFSFLTPPHPIYQPTELILDFFFCCCFKNFPALLPPSTQKTNFHPPPPRSANVVCNVPTGPIFSIFHRKSPEVGGGGVKGFSPGRKRPLKYRYFNEELLRYSLFFGTVCPMFFLPKLLLFSLYLFREPVPLLMTFSNPVVTWSVLVCWGAGY